VVVFSLSRGNLFPLALLSLLGACGESPIESSRPFPAGVTGQLALVTTKPKGTSFEAELRIMDALGRDNAIYSTEGYAIIELGWAPDGRHLAFVALLPGIGAYRQALYQIAIGDREPIPLFEKYHGPYENSPRYSRSGRLAYQATSGIQPGYGIYIDSVFAFPGLGAQYLDWTPDEQALVLSDSTDLLRLRVTDGTVTRIWSTPGDTVAGAAVSPDGTRIPFLRHAGPYSAKREVLTTGDYFDLYPIWTADGHYVAFVRRETPGAEGVYLVPALGGTATRLVAVADNRTWYDRLEPVIGTGVIHMLIGGVSTPLRTLRRGLGGIIFSVAAFVTTISHGGCTF
jgi:Tol biopolymer transport system component